VLNLTSTRSAAGLSYLVAKEPAKRMNEEAIRAIGQARLLLDRALALLNDQVPDTSHDKPNEPDLNEDDVSRRWRNFVTADFKPGGRNLVDWVPKQDRFSTLDLPVATQMAGGWGGVWASFLRTSEHHLGERIVRAVKTTWRGNRRIVHYEVNKHLIPEGGMEAK
jgi:hypothetical protein